MRTLLFAALVAVPFGFAAFEDPKQPAPEVSMKTPVSELGNFSVSLVVKDLAVSRAFYEKLGFKVVSGDAKQNWLVLREGTTKIGLFQGMFERNMLTFNPGWDHDAKTLESFVDVRELQRRFEAAGLKPTVRAEEKSEGTAYFMLADPDGNPILFDQHVPKPK